MPHKPLPQKRCKRCGEVKPRAEMCISGGRILPICLSCAAERPGVKWCFAHGAWEPIERFGINNDRPDGLASSCRDSMAPATRTCKRCGKSKPIAEFPGEHRCARVCQACKDRPRRRRKPRALCGLWDPELNDIPKPMCRFFRECRAMLSVAAQKVRREERASMGDDGVELPCFPTSVRHGDFLDYYAEDDEAKLETAPRAVRVGNVMTVTTGD